MPTLNHDKELQQCIEQLDSVPAGFTFNKNAVWDTIENKLQPVQKNKKSWWAYAAAIITLFCLGVIFISQKNDSPIAHKIIPIEYKNFIGSNNPIVVENPSKTKPKKIIQFSTTEKNTSTVEKKLLMAQSATTISVPILFDTLSGSIQPAFVKIEPTPDLKIKPKLKVVHLNDITIPSPLDIMEKKKTIAVGIFKRIEISSSTLTNSEIQQEKDN